MMMFRFSVHATLGVRGPQVRSRQLQGAQSVRFSSFPGAPFRQSMVLEKAQKNGGGLAKKGSTSKDATKTEFFDMSISTDIATNKRGRGNGGKPGKTEKDVAKIDFFDMSLPREISSRKVRSTQSTQQGTSAAKDLGRKEEVNKTKDEAGKIDFFNMSLSKEIAASEPKAQKASSVPKVHKPKKIIEKQAARMEFFDMSLMLFEVTGYCITSKRWETSSGKTGRKDQQAPPKKDLPKNKKGASAEKISKKQSKTDTATNTTGSPTSPAAVLPKLDLALPPNRPLSLSVLPKPAVIPKKKRKRVSSFSKSPFYVRLRQILLLYYSRLETSTLSASPEAKEFLRNTPFSDAYRLLSEAVNIPTKRLINSGSFADYRTLPKDCLVPNQGCYINIITQSDGSFGVYIGGACTITPRLKGVKRPLRGSLAQTPYAEPQAYGAAGVGRRVAQHLADAERTNSPTAHYRYMREEGSRYDFRLLAAFPKAVESGAVWVLESFLVEALGTLPVGQGPGVRRYRGLNRRDPLTTSVFPSKKVVGEDGKIIKVPDLPAGLPRKQTGVDVATLSRLPEPGQGKMNSWV